MKKSEFILRTLEVALWIRVTWGFVCQEMFTAFKPTLPFLYLAFDAVMIALGCWTLSDRRDKISGAVFLVVSAAITVLYNGCGVFFYLNGLRDFIGYVVVLPIIRYYMADDELRPVFVERMDRFLYLYLVLQVPCVLIQFFVHGAGDHVGGSLGDYTSGITSTLTYLISFYLLRKRLDRNNVFASLWEHKQFILLLFPTFLNETKVSFVYLAIYLLLLIPLDRKIFIRLTLAVPLMAALFYGSAVTYLVTTGNKAGDIFSLEYYTESYLATSDADATQRYAQWLIENGGDAYTNNEDVPRFTKFLFLFNLQEDEPGHTLTGWGVGHFKGGTIVANSDFYSDNEWLFLGTLPYLFFMLVQLGWTGVVMMVAYFALMIFSKPRAGLRRDYNLQLYLLALLLLTMLYQDFLRNVLMCLVLFYIAMCSWQPTDDEAPAEVAAPAENL